MNVADEKHSIERHPLRRLMTPEEWRRLRDDVQFCRVSWPVGIVVQGEETDGKDPIDQA